MVTIYIDKKKFSVKKEMNFLEACLFVGLDLPYFCWHPALGSIGSCRQCIVKKYKDINSNEGFLVAACMTPVSENSCISIHDYEAKKFRSMIIETLMTNHPHDCPICEEAGNCHLQDMTIMTGHFKRRYRFEKRIYRSQYLGPFIKHEMNRCISCYRCIRYYRDYAKGTDLNVYGVGNKIYFGRAEDGILESEFSGNLVEVCPTGVFTDKLYSENYSRKWDMQFSPSICMQCSIGCNISPGERYGKLCRIDNRYNHFINGHFLCDRGRFGVGYVDSINRPSYIKLNKIRFDSLSEISLENVLSSITSILKKSKVVLGIGSSRSSIENNYALMNFVGKDNFYLGISDKEYQSVQLILKIIKESGLCIPALSEIENYDCILILGEDVMQTAARVGLAIFQAINNRRKRKAYEYGIDSWNSYAISNINFNSKYPLFITSIDSTKLDNLAKLTYYGSIDNQARFGFSIANNLDSNSPKVTNLSNLEKDKIYQISKTLLNSKKPLIISGSSSGSTKLIQASLNVALALKSNNIDVGVFYVLSEVNSFGLSLMSLKPLDYALKRIVNEEVNTLIVLENDLYRHTNINLEKNIFSKIDSLIVFDHIKTFTVDKSDIFLPSSNFLESTGTVINNEGRVQRYYQLFDPYYYNKETLIKKSWEWINLIRIKLNKNCFRWNELNDLIKDCYKYFDSELKFIFQIFLDVFRKGCEKKVSRSSDRYSGRSILSYKFGLKNKYIPKDTDTMFSYSMEGVKYSQINRFRDIPFISSPGWNSSEALNKFLYDIIEDFKREDDLFKVFKRKKSSYMNYFSYVPKVWKKKQDKFIIVPYYYLFGSDEASKELECFQEISKDFFVVLNENDLTYYHLRNKSFIKFDCESRTYHFQVRISKNLDSGQIGIPIGINNIPFSLIGKYAENLRIDKKRKSNELF